MPRTNPPIKEAEEREEIDEPRIHEDVEPTRTPADDDDEDEDEVDDDDDDDDEVAEDLDIEDLSAMEGPDA